MIQVKQIPRKFIFKNGGEDTILRDFDPTVSPDEIMSFYANIHPELVNATYNEKGIENDILVYEFTTTVGTKG